jgi:hypothetical protein
MLLRSDRARIDPIEKRPKLHVGILYGRSGHRKADRARPRNRGVRPRPGRLGGTRLWLGNRRQLCYVNWNTVAFWPVEGRERSSGAGLWVLQAMRLVDDEDGPREVIE